MHKHTIITAGVFLFLLSCQQKDKDEYTVKGVLKNTPAKTVFLEEVSPESMQPVIVDSATISNNGSYDLSTLARGEALYTLRLQDNRFPFVSFINDTENVTINADFNKPEDPYTVKGSPASEALKNYIHTIGTKLDALQGINLPADTVHYKKEQRDSIRNVYSNKQVNAKKDIKTFAANFINKSQYGTLSLYALSSYQSIANNPSFGLEPFTEEDLKSIVGSAAKKFPQNKALVAVHNSLQGKPIVKSAPDFTLPDVNGQPISLSSFKGKYVLVDFWASWCPPCRAENPNLVAAYQKFKDKNFTILGVSLDKEKSAWLQGIKEDNLTWTHVSDLSFWDSKVVPLYGIEAIPYNVLLDPNGNVIGESLTGAGLEKKLAEVIK